MNLDKVLARVFPPVEATLTPRDCMLYAAGIGVGQRVTDARDLQFLYERELAVFPSFVNVIAHPGGWLLEPELQIDYLRLLHGEQAFELLQPLQPDKTYVGTYAIVDVVDKGPGKGALMFLRKELREKAGNTLVSVVTSTYFLRGDGGCGGTTTQVPAPHAVPERAPDGRCALPTLPQAALIYRLSGDYNPIHADPESARRAGFEQPILHGLCTLGVATRAILQSVCDDRPGRLRSLSARFSSPVYPGETIVTEYWRDGGVVSFRCRVAERDGVVLSGGRAEVLA